MQYAYTFYVDLSPLPAFRIAFKSLGKAHVFKFGLSVCLSAELTDQPTDQLTVLLLALVVLVAIVVVVFLISRYYDPY